MSPYGSERLGSTVATAERGSALVWALFFVTLITGVLIAHSLEMSANRRTMDTRYRRVDLAKNVAESGLTEGAAYLRRQPTQPVTVFAPQLDLAADPPLNETLDPSIGLVREFEVSAGLWGRYEIRKDQALDVSPNYGEPPGTVWDIEARGYLYERTDAQKRFDQRPNRVISEQKVRTEMRGLPVQVPAPSAVVVMNPSQVTMLGNAEILGNGMPAIGYCKPAGALVVPVLDVTITGSPLSIAINDLSIAVKDVFGVRSEQVRNLSDIVLASPRQIYGHVANDIAVYAPGGLTLPAAGAALRGRMLLFVDGDFTAMSGNNSDFSGVLYVTGNAAIEGPFRFRGAMIVAGTLRVGQTSSGWVSAQDLVSIGNDQTAVQKLREALARYRISKDMRPSTSKGAFADPADLRDLDAVVR
jgi:hypothetical protein